MNNPGMDRAFFIHHAVFLAISGLLLYFMPHKGWAAAICTGLYYLATLAVVAINRYVLWTDIFFYTAGLSLFMVIPDAVLVNALGTLKFAGDGVPTLGAVPFYMLGMWTIPLSITTFIARRSDTRSGGAGMYGSAVFFGLLIFGLSEYLLPMAGIWTATEAVKSTMGGLAWYVLLAELTLVIAVVYWQKATSKSNPLARLLSSIPIMLIYTGSLACFYWIIEK